MDKEILKKRLETYQIAKKKNPERWIKNKICNWDWIEEQILNPNKTVINEKKKKRQVA